MRYGLQKVSLRRDSWDVVSGENQKNKYPMKHFVFIVLIGCVLLSKAEEVILPSSVPALPFEKTNKQLVEEFLAPKDGYDLKAMGSLLGRCGGLIALLIHRPSLTEITMDIENAQMLEVLHAMFSSNSFLRKFPDQTGLTRADFDKHMFGEAAEEIDAFSDTYAQWIVESKVSDQTLADNGHPFTVEYNVCETFGRQMLDGAKYMQGG